MHVRVYLCTIVYDCLYIRVCMRMYAYVNGLYVCVWLRVFVRACVCVRGFVYSLFV